MANMQPAPMTLDFVTPVVAQDSTGNFTIDLSQVASAINRRFYRQGLNWAVGGFKFISPVTGSIKISKLPNTWSLANGWTKTFKSWQRQQREALEDGQQESVAAKFNDFKIHMDTVHVAAGFSSNLLPRDASFNTALPGEWQASQLVVPNFGGPGTNYEPLIMGVGDRHGGFGAPGSAFSLIELYQNSRSVPQSPDPAVPAPVLSSDNILNLMFDVGDNNTDVLENAITKNDDLPYDQNEYPGGPTNMPGLQTHDVAQVVSYGAPTDVGTQYCKGGSFPCGLIRVSYSPTGNSSALGILIDLVPGNQRGYMTESMMEM